MEAQRPGILLSAPSVHLFLFFLVPLAVMATYPFRAGAFGAERDVFTWEHVQLWLDTPAFRRLLLQSAGMALAAAALSVILAYPLAYFLSFRAGHAKGLLLTILIIPAWTSCLLRILAWKLILGSTGVINSLLLSVGLIRTASPLLLYGPSAVLVTLIYIWVPFAALPIFSSLERIDRTLLDASSDLGASSLSTFLRVTLPLSLTGVGAGFFFVFVPTLGEWVTPALVGGAQGIMYGNLIQDQFVRALNWPLGALLSMIMLIPAVLLSLLFTRLTRTTLHAAA